MLSTEKRDMGQTVKHVGSIFGAFLDGFGLKFFGSERVPSRQRANRRACSTTLGQAEIAGFFLTRSPPDPPGMEVVG